MPRGNAWDARSAASTAAYLALVTPAGPGGAGYDLARLLIRSRALDELPGLHARVEVYHGTAPLVHATAPGLAPETLDALRRRADVPWAGAGAARGGRVALAPLFDRQGWDVVGAVAARAAAPTRCGRRSGATRPRPGCSALWPAPTCAPSPATRPTCGSPTRAC